MSYRYVFLAAFVLLFSGPAGAAVCGGPGMLQCGAKEWCNFSADNLCGIRGVVGKCDPRPTACTFIFLPVCGCNGVTYSNACLAHAQGQSVAYAGTCRAIETTTCVQVVSCGIKDGKPKQYPTPCDAAKDGATNIVPRTGDSCPAIQ